MLFPHARASGRATRHSSRGFGPRVRGSGGASRRSVGLPGTAVSIAPHDPAKPAGCLRAPVGVEDQGRPARLWPSGEVHRVHLRMVSVAWSGTEKGAGFAGPRPGEAGLSRGRTLRRVFGPIGVDDRAVPCGSLGPTGMCWLSVWEFASFPIRHPASAGALPERTDECRSRFSGGCGFIRVRLGAAAVYSGSSGNREVSLEATSQTKKPRRLRVQEPSPVPRGVGVVPSPGHGGTELPFHPAPHSLAGAASQSNKILWHCRVFRYI